MQVTASSTARELARSSMGAEMAFPQGANNVSTGSLRMQNKVPPEERMQVTATVTNNAQIIVGDTDSCDAGFFQKGYLIDLELYVDGSFVDSIQNCTAGMGGSFDGTFEFLAPKNEGEYDVTVKAVGSKSGNVGDSTSETLTVSTDAPGYEKPGNEKNKSGVYLPCFMDPNRQCTTGETMAFAGMGGGLALLFLLAMVGG